MFLYTHEETMINLAGNLCAVYSTNLLQMMVIVPKFDIHMQFWPFSRDSVHCDCVMSHDRYYRYNAESA